MNIIKFLFILCVSALTFSSFVCASDSELDIEDFGINGCEDNEAYTLVFDGLRNYGKITSIYDRASFVAGISEIRKSPRIVSRIKNSGKKQSLILRINQNTYKILERQADDDYELKMIVKSIVDKYKERTRWRLFYVMLPYGTSEKIIKAFNQVKVSVVSTAVKVPQNMSEAVVSEFKGIVIVDTKSYDFEQKTLDKFTTDAISLTKCIPRGSVALEKSNTPTTSAAREPFSLLIKGGLKHYDVVKVLDFDSAFAVTLNELSNYESLIRGEIIDSRELVVYITRENLSSYDSTFETVASFNQESGKYASGLKHILISEEATSEFRDFFVSLLDENVKIINDVKQFTSSDAEKANASQRFNFKGSILVDLEEINPDVSGKSEEEKIKSEKEYLFNMLQAAKSKMYKQELDPVPISQLTNPAITEESKREQFRSRYSTNYYWRMRFDLTRENYFEESFTRFEQLSNYGLRSAGYQITFAGEPGIDAGGLTREWYSLMIRRLFDPDTGLFVSESGQNTFHPNPDSGSTIADHLQYFTFAGRFIAKALIDKYPIGRHFSRALCKLILGQSPTLFDLKDIDGSNLSSLLKTATELDNDTLSYIYFTNTKGDVELKPGGDEIEVSDENKYEYVSLMAQYIMITSRKPQIDAFLDGFYQVIPKDHISVFTPGELSRFITGSVEIDIDEWERVTVYSYPYTAESNVVKWFWKAVRSFKRQSQAGESNGNDTCRNLLRFATGSPNVPTNFSIHKSYNRPDHLPEAHTCFNQIDIPEYPDYKTLRKRLSTAANFGSEGFDMR